MKVVYVTIAVVDQEMELPTTAGKEFVDITLAVEDEQENSIAVVLDQEID